MTTDSSSTAETLANLSREDRRFEPPADLAANANVTAEAYEQASARTRSRSGRSRPTGSSWAERWDTVLDDSRPPVLQVVHGRQAQRGVQLRRPPRRGGPRGQGRDPLGRRARGRHPRHHLCAAQGRGVAGGQRADRAGRRGRRPGRDLHADDPRGDRRDAGLRADRRPAHGGVRRLLRRRAGLADRGLPGEGSSSPPTAATAAAPRRRSSRRSTRHGPRLAKMG